MESDMEKIGKNGKKTETNDNNEVKRTER